MDTNPTKPSSKMDDKKESKPAVATTRPTATATTKPDACASTSNSDARGKPDAQCKTYDGTVVSITGNKLVMSNLEGKEFSHTVASDAKVCCDGTACCATDLKVGSKIRVTSNPNDKNTATRIESLDKNAEFAQTA